MNDPRLTFFWRILLPLSGPGLVTVGVLAFVGSWNAYLLPLLVLNDPQPIEDLPEIGCPPPLVQGRHHLICFVQQQIIQNA